MGCGGSDGTGHPDYPFIVLKEGVDDKDLKSNTKNAESKLFQETKDKTHTKKFLKVAGKKGKDVEIAKEDFTKILEELTRTYTTNKAYETTFEVNDEFVDGLWEKYGEGEESIKEDKVHEYLTELFKHEVKIGKAEQKARKEE